MALEQKWSTRIRTYFHAIKPRAKDPQQCVPFILFALCAGCALLMRWYLFPHVSVDLTDYVGQWYDFLKLHGHAAFKHPFADYTPPYLYMLYALTKLPLAKLTAIKALSTCFDIILALSVFCVVRHYKQKGWAPYLAALVCLFLPTVFINSSFWGQCDALYTSVLVFSYYAFLREKHKTGWLLWGLAFSIKLQAIFFLPFLLLMWIRRLDHWYEPLVAIPLIGTIILSPALAGQTLQDLLGVYGKQAGEYDFLTMFAPNLYLWIPNQYFSLFHAAGIALTAGVSLFFVLCLYLYTKPKPGQLLGACCLLLLVVPFLLPQMHERYFYPAEIFSLLVAFVLPRLFWLPILMQITSFFAYMPYVLHVLPPVSVTLLPFGILACIVGLSVALFTAPAAKP